MAVLGIIETTFRTTDEFEKISKDGSTIELGIQFSSDKGRKVFRKAIKDLIDSNVVSFLYDSPELNEYCELGGEYQYKHYPRIDLKICTKKSWKTFSIFFKEFMIKNNYISYPLN